MCSRFSVANGERGASAAGINRGDAESRQRPQAFRERGNKEGQAFKKGIEVLVEGGGVVYTVDNVKANKVVLPQALQREAMAKHAEGHFGRKKILSRLRQQFFWKPMEMTSRSLLRVARNVHKE